MIFKFGVGGGGVYSRSKHDNSPVRYIFIHINKTGGSSIEKALNLPFEHKTALEKIKEVGEKEWKSHFTFAVVRNPWDKVVSHYHYRLMTNQTNMRNSQIDFKDWVERAYGRRESFYYDNPKMFMPQVDWISDEKGSHIVNQILYFENLECEFNSLLKQIGGNAVLPHLKKTKRDSYKKYYDEKTIYIVKSWFQRDIDEFGYQF